MPSNRKRSKARPLPSTAEQERLLKRAALKRAHRQEREIQRLARSLDAQIAKSDRQLLTLSLAWAVRGARLVEEPKELTE